MEISWDRSFSAVHGDRVEARCSRNREIVASVRSSVVGSDRSHRAKARIVQP
jgi:hypothetical protein